MNPNMYDIDEEDNVDYYKKIERGTQIKTDICKDTYIIINEIRKSPYSMTYSAIKVNISDNKNLSGNSLIDNKYLIKLYKRELIEEYVINKLNIRESAKMNYFEDLVKIFKNNIEDIELGKKKHFIQQIYDIHINEIGVYIVMEFLETPLVEYLHKFRDSIKSNKCCELKYKNIIIPLLNILYELDYKVSFAGLLNSSDIYINDSSSNSNFGQSSFIKITHPFFNQLETVFKMLDNSQFPNFYPPEFINQFKEDKYGKIVMDCSDLSEAFSLINHNFDMWAFGYLLYEILYEIVPFRFDNLERAKTAFQKNRIVYKVKKNKYSDFIMDLIMNSLKFEKRLNLKNIKLDLYKEALNDDKNFETFNLKYLMNPERYKENEEENVAIIREI